MPQLSEQVAASVALLLRERRLSVRKAAGVLDMHRQTLADKLSGRTRFSLDDAQLIAERLHVPLAELLEAPSSLIDESSAVAS